MFLGERPTLSFGRLYRLCAQVGVRELITNTSMGTLATSVVPRDPPVMAVGALLAKTRVLPPPLRTKA